MERVYGNGWVRYSEYGYPVVLPLKALPEREDGQICVELYYSE